MIASETQRDATARTACLVGVGSVRGVCCWQGWQGWQGWLRWKPQHASLTVALATNSGQWYPPLRWCQQRHQWRRQRSQHVSRSGQHFKETISDAN
eukprot:COSAG02_NODE_2609_length_8435_cov_4.723129_8_plen_96_part_00